MAPTSLRCLARAFALSFMITSAFAGAQVRGPSPSSCPGDAVSAASRDIVAAALQPYCSTLLGYTTPVATTTTYTTNPTVTYTETDVVYTGTTTVTVGYTVGTATYTTQIFAKRAMAASTPAPLTKFPGNVITSACSLVASPETTTYTWYVEAPITVVQTFTSINSPEYTYVPIATTTYATVTYNCNLKGRENRALVYPGAGSLPGLTSDGSGGIENCTMQIAKDWVNAPSFFLDSVAIGVRENGRTYCDFYQGPAAQIASSAPADGLPGWVYWDKQCPGFLQ